MIYRLFVALTFTLLVFPFAAMYSFAAIYPDAHFAFDRQTWLQGLAPILFGWVLFLLPGLIPFFGYRYYDWVARKTGFEALFAGIGNGLQRLRTGFASTNARTRQAIANRPSGEGWKTALRSVLDRFRNMRAQNSSETDTVSQPAADVAESLQTKKSRLRQRANVTDTLEKARGVIKDAPRHVAQMKQTIESLRHHLTPDELQRTIDLNQYTLEAFAHLKSILSHLLRVTELSDAERAYANAVVEGIPQPPSTSTADEQPAPSTFVFPPELRDDLRQHAAKSRLMLREMDFLAAENGDLERALLVLRAIVGRETGRCTMGVDSSDEFVVGLP